MKTAVTRNQIQYGACQKRLTLYGVTPSHSYRRFSLTSCNDYCHSSCPTLFSHRGNHNLLFLWLALLAEILRGGRQGLAVVSAHPARPAHNANMHSRETCITALADKGIQFVASKAGP